MFKQRYELQAQGGVFLLVVVIFKYKHLKGDSANFRVTFSEEETKD